MSDMIILSSKNQYTGYRKEIIVKFDSSRFAEMT